MKSSKRYPENLEISETSAKCSAQSMVNHTLSGIRNIPNAKCLDGSKTTNRKNVQKQLENSKMDGASTQSIYSQRFDDTDLAGGIENEQFLFQAAIVALKLENRGHHCMVKLKAFNSPLLQVSSPEITKRNKGITKS